MQSQGRPARLAMLVNRLMFPFDKGAIRNLARSRFSPSTESGHGSSRCHAMRSEEHTSELQSLMRISYAVLCLHKQNQTLTTRNYTTLHIQTSYLHQHNK